MLVHNGEQATLWFSIQNTPRIEEIFKNLEKLQSCVLGIHYYNFIKAFYPLTLHLFALLTCGYTSNRSYKLLLFSMCGTARIWPVRIWLVSIFFTSIWKVNVIKTWWEITKNYHFKEISNGFIFCSLDIEETIRR